jgi:hypothetical protein
MVAKRIGREADIAVSNADSGYTELSFLKSVDFDPSNDEIDASDNDSGGSDETEYGQSRAALSGTMNYDHTDAGQLELQQAFEGKTKLWFRFRPKSTSGEREARFQAVVTSFKISGATGGIQEASFSAKSDGVVTYANQ